MDFLHQLKEYIEDNFTIFRDDVAIGVLRSEGDDIAIRPTPSTITLRDMAEGRIINYSFQLLTCHRLERTAYEKAEEIALTLERLNRGAITSGDASFSFIRCRMTTTVNFVERSKEGAIYTALFAAELLI